MQRLTRSRVVSYGSRCSTAEGGRETIQGHRAPMGARGFALSALVVGLTAIQARAQECDSGGVMETLVEGTSGTNGVPCLDPVGVPLMDKAFWFELNAGRPGARGLLVGSRHAAPGLARRGVLYPTPPFLVQSFVLDGQGVSASAVPAADRSGSVWSRGFWRRLWFAIHWRRGGSPSPTRCGSALAVPPMESSSGV